MDIVLLSVNNVKLGIKKLDYVLNAIKDINFKKEYAIK